MAQAADRKSTRLNSSHLAISYAVFCLKKKNAHHGLFVELWALSQVRRPAEVVEGKDIGSALVRRPNDLGRLDLGETQLVQRRPQSGHRGGRDGEHGAVTRVAQGDGSVIEDGR